MSGRRGVKEKENNKFLMYKIIFGMCDVDLNDILLLRGDISIRGHQYKLMQERCTH